MVRDSPPRNSDLLTSRFACDFSPFAPTRISDLTPLMPEGKGVELLIRITTFSSAIFGWVYLINSAGLVLTFVPIDNANCVV